MDFLRRNINTVLLACLIVLMVIIWRLVAQIAASVEFYGCGRLSFPCKVIVVPDR